MKRVLVIAVHPDDEVLGCGGTIAKHTDAGDLVEVVIVTKGDSKIFAREIVNRGRQECRDANERLGVSDVQFLNFSAPKLDTYPAHELADRLTRIVREFQADIVYIPHSGDLHFEHVLTHRAAQVACRPNGGHSVSRILSYETLSETDWAPDGEAFEPNVYIDISDVLERKLEAMACYTTQLQDPPATRSLRSIRALAEFRGGTVHCEAAEAFRLMREIC
jgi:LmbE family N-acetylglucosaminyl deacetylase